MRLCSQRGGGHSKIRKSLGNGSQASPFCIVYFETTFDANRRDRPARTCDFEYVAAAFPYTGARLRSMA